MGMIRYEDAVRELEEQQEKERSRLKKQKPLFRLAMEYGSMFSHNHDLEYISDVKERSSQMTYAVGSSTIDCVALDLYLEPSDDMTRDVGPIIEELKDHPRLKLIGDNDYIEVGWKGWEFRYRDFGVDEKFLVRAWFGSSKSCKVVGTGEFKEVKKVVCG